MENTITISEDQAGERLDKALPDVLGQSRSQVQKAIKNGHVFVNDKKVTPHYPVKEGDIVTWDLDERRVLVTPNEDVDIPVLFENDDMVVIVKPAGVVVHQGDGHREPDTVANWLLARVPEVKELGDDPVRPGIVHRLDRDVSGVMILAKTQGFFEYIIGQFSQSAVEKEYAAVVYGAPEQLTDTLRFRLARSKTKSGKVAALPLSEKTEGREAQTDFEVIDARQHYALLAVSPKTGRMHQIRAHLAAIGYAIVGDTLYAKKDMHPERAPRLFLHATRLAFTDQHGAQHEYTSPAPHDFVTFLDNHS